MADLIIVGGSARAAAGSALRAGLVPWCADLFADADLRAMVPRIVRCPAGQYPGGLSDILVDAPACPWMYTGALENHPNLIRRLAGLRPLWGNGPNALVASRSPFHVSRLLRDAGLPSPEVRAADAELPDYCDWLRKPLAGSAGQGVAPASSRPTRRTGRWYFQQFLAGPSLSAVFVRMRGEVRLLGATEQLIGVEWLNAHPFRYCGNVGPARLSPEQRKDLDDIGRVLGEGCDLLGVFGVDFILHDGRPWVVEVNPRYPASVEVLERSTGMLVIPLHRMAFDPEAVGLPQIPSHGTVAGKAVVYAPRTLTMPHYGPDQLSDAMFDSGVRAARHLTPIHFADVPNPGEVIESGWPVLTVLAQAGSRNECVGALAEGARRVQEFLSGRRQPQPPEPN